MDWATAKKRADESGGGKYLSLKNDKDSAVGCFVGEVELRELWYNKTTEEYEDYTAEHKAKGLTASPRFMINLWLRTEKICKIWELNGATFADLFAAKEKYGFDDYAFEIQRHGKAKDTKTTYSVLPEKLQVTAEEKAIRGAATLHDLKAEIAGTASNAAATDMDSHDKKKTNGATNGAATNGQPAADAIDPETKTRIVQRLKQHPRDKTDAFLAHFKAKKVGELKKSDVAAAEAMLDTFEGKPATPAAEAENDPFA